jgi:hypothetical protein
VQEQHLQLRVGADPFRPDAERAARRLDRHHARSPREHVARIPRGRVEVRGRWMSHRPEPNAHLRAARECLLLSSARVAPTRGLR